MHFTVNLFSVVINIYKKKNKSNNTRNVQSCTRLNLLDQISYTSASWSSFSSVLLQTTHIANRKKRKKEIRLPTWRWLFSETVICQRRPETINKGKLNGHTQHTLPARAMDSSSTELLVHRLLPPLNAQTPPVMFMSSLNWIPHEGLALEECGSIQKFNLKSHCTDQYPVCRSSRKALVKLILGTELPLSLPPHHTHTAKDWSVLWEVCQLS